ncbi:MAG: PEP/pyruvate-binding domain-containing protein [Microthrixaceae bacterium]
MIELLTSSTTAGLTHIGGKGAGLVRLLRAGLTVPEAFVIPAPVSIDSASRERCLDSELPEWWEQVSTEFPRARWAVRSSAVAEDLEGASFAGVYETVLDVDSLERLREAVRAGWAALDDDRAEVYRDRRSLESSGGIALVLQRMVEPRVSGVLLTANPMRPFASEVAIDAAWGLGEAIVSGRTDPDHLVIGRADGEIREELIGAKAIEITWDGGPVERDVDEERRSRRSLSDDDIRMLLDLARTVEQSIGGRRDIEWAIDDSSAGSPTTNSPTTNGPTTNSPASGAATNSPTTNGPTANSAAASGAQLYALQDRPITGLPPLDPENVWSRRWADEYLADYAMPLSQGLLTEWIAVGFLEEMAKLQGRKDLAGIPALKNHNGYSYFSGLYLARMLAAFPPSLRRSAVGNWFTPLWNERVMAMPWQPRALIGTLIAPYRDGRRGRRSTNPEALAEHCATIDRVLVPKLWADLSELTDQEWHREFDQVNELGLEHFRVIRWGMAHHGPMLHASLSQLLKNWAGDNDGELYQSMISGLPGTRTAEINRAVWDLAVVALDDESLADELRSDSDYRTVREQSSGSPFWKNFDRFMDTYGHRSSSREISAPRWIEEPDVIAGLVRAQLRCNPFPLDPRTTEEAAQQRRRSAEDTAFGRARKGRLGGLRRGYLRKVCRITQNYTVYRENQRFHLDYLSAYVRRLVLEQGRRLTENETIGEPVDVFLMTKDELWAAIAGRVDTGLGGRIEERREHYLVHRDRLPASFLFDDVESEGEVVDGEPTDKNTGDGLPGLGASRGTARGSTRVVLGLADLAKVKPGDILVANNIDPGWTSVFPLLAGLVTETGGILSHGAILAREYGIPTVTGVKDAVAALPTGTLVEIDGSIGRIRMDQG